MTTRVPSVSGSSLSAQNISPQTIGAPPPRREWLRYLLGVGVFAIALVLLIQVRPHLEAFPTQWNLHLREPIDQFASWVIRHRADHPLFVYGFEPFSNTLDTLLRRLEAILLALPWPVVLVAVGFVAYRASGIGVAVFSIAALLFVGMVGLWEESLQTFALMGVSVLICLLIGIPLGMLSARSDRFNALLRPILDSMQTMPAFVYLIPVLLFFGVARVPSIVATVIYALPPSIRLTNSGIRQTPAQAVEAADAFGSTSWQKLIKVELPLAMPSILAGVNQTIMMALGMVVIAALIGAGGLGGEVWIALQRQRFGLALEAGLAIVFMAILLDRISYGYSQELHEVLEGNIQTRHPMRPSVLQAWHTYGYWRGAILVTLLLLGLNAYVVEMGSFPQSWHFSIQDPVDGGVRWMRDHLYQLGTLPIGTGPFSDFVTIWLLNPLRSLLQDGLPWPAVVLGFALIGYLAKGWRLGLFSALAILMTGFLGLWMETMDTLSQVIVAVLIALAIGLPLGVWSARREWVEQLLRPILDFLQTIPVFVYLVPVIILFHVGRVPGIIASVLYAIPPVVRLTALGIRQVSPESVEAAAVFGSTSWQTLFKVQIPLAMPTILLGINQTVMMVLAMVIIAGLVGGGALGLEAVTGLAKSELGRGIEAGLAIVILAIVLDRITQSGITQTQV